MIERECVAEVGARLAATRQWEECAYTIETGARAGARAAPTSEGGRENMWRGPEDATKHIKRPQLRERGSEPGRTDKGVDLAEGGSSAPGETKMEPSPTKKRYKLGPNGQEY